ncbi:Predicted amidohydrolase [Pseudobutyrivibrio sp. C4]|uniref:hypothetical protein n=1 Tax=Pseudobutyrivibrio sp. C4 TaxID=1520803 RepID=UPI0008CE888F|nr:hypothetical protein [Pseudobutyrivibrio sp. C4]SES65792.1 Predicted amidohydrolase [Pseudobutyrivibrio sp. C4]
MDNINVYEAYRKLKGSVYYDNSLAFVRTKIAEYEGKNLEKKLEDIAEVIQDGQEFDELNKRILDSIEVLTFPKQVKYKDSENDEGFPCVFSNIHSSSCTIDSYNTFINMSIEGYLIGVLWCMYIGTNLDKNLGKSIYGNRIEDGTNSDINVFKFYKNQYNAWSDDAIRKANEIINKGNDVIITKLDLKRFYYNIELDINKYLMLTHNEGLSMSAKRINRIVYNIIDMYSSKCKYGRLILPLGFYPSEVLANVYLMDLDNRICNISGTEYYGRYVDDIFWVKKVDNDSIKDAIKNKGTDIISKFVLKELNDNNVIELDDKDIYIYGEKHLQFQRDKFLVYYFDHNRGEEYLEKFKRDMIFISGDYIQNDYNDELEAYITKDSLGEYHKCNNNPIFGKSKIDYKIINKQINEQIEMSPFYDETEVGNFVEELEKIFDSKVLIENYKLWERVLDYYIINEQFEDVVTFTNNINDTLNQMDEFSNKVKVYEYLNGDSIFDVDHTLRYYYISCVIRSFSLVWGQEIKIILKRIIDIIRGDSTLPFSSDYAIELRYKYIQSKMNDKDLLPINMRLITRIVNFEDSPQTINITDLDMLKSEKIKKQPYTYNYWPYHFSAFEIGFSILIEQLYFANMFWDSLIDTPQYLERLIDEYRLNSSNIYGDELSEYIKREDDSIIFNSLNTFDDYNPNDIGGFEEHNNRNHVRIAVANVRMNENDINSIIDGKSGAGNDRVEEIKYLTESAVKNKADVLVLPEAYVPLRGLFKLYKYSNSNNMMIICGVEHIKQAKNIWNLTCALVPIRIGGATQVIPLFRQKKYYSPDEEKTINKHHLNIPPANKNYMYNWKNFNFAIYCCYELTNINYRSEFIKNLEVLFGIEWNKDITYFSNIMESLSRDMYCYCVQANMSKYGDSRIVVPAHKYNRDIIRVKGGENATILVGEIDIDLLREAKKNPKIRKDNSWAELPAGY